MHTHERSAANRGHRLRYPYKCSILRGMGSRTRAATRAAARAAEPVTAESVTAESAGSAVVAERGAVAEVATLPVADPLRSLLPEGLRRGATVSVAGSTALALAVLAEPLATDHWAAGMGWDRVGLVAAHELGVSWERMVLVDAPNDRRQWVTAASTLVDAFDLVVFGSDTRIPAADARKLVARARERRAVLVMAAGPQGCNWPLGADVSLRVLKSSWKGLGDGHGHLTARRMVVEATGRGRLAQPRRLDLWLPAPGGGVKRAGLAAVDRDASSPAAPALQTVAS